MSNESQPNDQESIIPDSPPANMISGQQRKKRSAKGLAIMGGFIVIASIIMWNLFFAGGEEQVQLNGQNVAPPGRAQIEGDVQVGGSGGGMRQEYAQLQSELEEEEARLERAQSGRSSITLGEVPIDMAEEVVEEEAPEVNNTFGAIAAEPPPPPPRTQLQPGRRVVSMDQSASTSQQGGGINPVLAEMEKMSSLDEASGWHSDVFYVEDSSGQVASGAIQTGRMPITPQLENRYYGNNNSASSSGSSELQPGSLAMPGETPIAYMQNRISSDQPSGTVVAHVLSGKLEGSRLLGSSNLEGERILVNFDRLVTADGDYYTGLDIDAVDPKSLDASLQSGVNRRLFVRYGVPILYGITSLGIEYAGQRDTITVEEEDLQTGNVTRRSVRSNESFEEFAGSRVADNINEPLSDAASRAANVQPLVWADPGVIGLLINTPIPNN